MYYIARRFCKDKKKKNFIFFRNSIKICKIEHNVKML